MSALVSHIFRANTTSCPAIRAGTTGLLLCYGASIILSTTLVSRLYFEDYMNKFAAENMCLEVRNKKLFEIKFIYNAIFGCCRSLMIGGVYSASYPFVALWSYCKGIIGKSLLHRRCCDINDAERQQ